jgi:DNA-directed RNA polymerase specialized sigma24 family protein
LASPRPSDSEDDLKGPEPETSTAANHISQIKTNWQLVTKAVRAGNSEPSASVRAAQAWLWERYSGAVRRYLRRVLGDPDQAEEVCQEFAVRLVRGDFSGIDPGEGRFRQYLKTALFHLVVDFRRAQQREPKTVAIGDQVLGSELTPFEVAERHFNEAWCQHLIDLAWLSLRVEEEKTGRPLATVLRFRSEYPEDSNGQIADRLSTTLGKQVNAAWTAKRLHLARNRLADMLVEEVYGSLGDPTISELEAELATLGLNRFHVYRDALLRRSRTMPR